MGGAEKPIGMLDSAIESDYVHSHERLIQHIEGCGMLGGEYVNIHPSETTPFIRLAIHLQPTKLVDPWGRPLNIFLKENPKILNWAIEQTVINDIMRSQFRIKSVEEILENLEMRVQLQKKELSAATIQDLRKEAEKRHKESLKNLLLNFVSITDLAYGPERNAYYIIAKWMQENKDPLWKNIVGKSIPDDKLPDKHLQWVPAVSSKYIWGHFNPKNSKHKDPKPLLKKHKIYIVFEAQMGSAGLEGLYRLTRPRDMAFLCKAIGSKWVGVTFDFEHVLSQNIKPIKEIESIPYGLAIHIKVCHLGWPTPHVPAHMPIPVGSEAHIYLYERLFELRKKGFKDGFLIFERAAAGRGTTIIAIRLIKHYLERDIPPKELPLKFFGMDERGPDIKRQEVAIREHFFDPLKGMLIVPEEEYTFLSKAAKEKGKAEVWKKERYR